MRTLTSVLREHYINNQSRLFCRFISSSASKDITYKELVENSAGYALHFKNSKVSKGDSVIIILKHSPHLFYSFIGAIMIGAIPSFLPFPSEKQDPNLHMESIEKLTRRIHSKSIVTYKEHFQEIGQLAGELGIDAVMPEQIQSTTKIIWDENIKEEDVAFLQHSSGTTGLKKGVALSHKAVLDQIENYSKAIKLDKNDVISSWLPLYHDMGLIACFIMPLINNIPIVMMDPFEWVTNPKMLFEHIEKNKATLCWLPNFAYNLLSMCIDTNSERCDLSSIRAFIDCSEPCKPHSFEIFYNSFKNYGVKMETLQTCYAMAENVFGITQSAIGEAVKVDYVDKEEFINKHHAKKSSDTKNCLKFLSVGNAIPHTEIRIVDDKRRIIYERNVGEIAIKSNSLFSGYFKLPEESAKVMQEGWFYTGDLGYLADGELYITGRKKDLIIVHGKNYYAHDIEYIANHIDGIKKGRCVAIGVYDDRLGSEDVVIIAETEKADSATKERISKEIKKKVSEELNLLVNEVYLVPLKWMTKTTSGKISRRENKRKYLKEKSGIEIED